MPKSDPKDLCPPAKYKPRRGVRPLSAAEIKAAADRAGSALEAHRSIFGDEAKDDGVTITRGQPRRSRPTTTTRPKSEVDREQRHRHFGTLSRVHGRIDEGPRGKCRWP